MKKFIQVIQPALLIILVLLVFYFRFDARANPWGEGYNFDMLFVVVYTLWLTYELNVGSADAARNKQVSDVWTAVLYGAGQALVILTALWFGPLWEAPGPWHIAGGAMFAMGIALRAWAIRTLGAHYSHLVSLGDNHRVIDTGPYRVLRHPAYAGMILAHAGVALWFLNMVTLAALVLALVPGIAGRILEEEKTLMKLEGYADFAKTRARLVPFVW